MGDFEEGYLKNIKMISKCLRFGESYDIVRKKIKLGSKEATFFALDGFLKDEMLDKNFQFLVNLTDDDMKKADTAEKFVDRFVTYIEASAEDSLDKLIQKKQEK